MTRQMCQVLSDRGHEICIVAASTRRAQILLSSKLKKLVHKEFYRINDIVIPNNWLFSKFLNRLINWLQELYLNFIINPQVISFARKNRVDCIWSILQGKSMIVSTWNIVRKLNIPLVTQVWDDPNWVLMNSGLDLVVQKDLFKKFDYLIASSQVCATASWQMSKQYEKKYKVKTIPIVAPGDKKLSKKFRKMNVRQIHIALAGQLYAQTEWQALVQALSNQNWFVLGKPVKLHLFGHFLKNDFNKDLPIELHSYKSQTKLIELLSDMDICYCPYWFDRSFEAVAKTSFPSKITSYLVSGRPVLFHGPKYASPAVFIEENGCGVCCYSLESQDIIKAIEAIIQSPAEYKKLVKNGRQAFLKYLTLNNFESSVKELFSFK